jgi:hypothetical protein
MSGVFGLQAERRAGQTDLEQAGAERRLTGNERCASRRATLLGVIVCEQRPFFREAIKVRRRTAHHAAMVSADVPESNIIAEDNEDVRLVGRTGYFTGQELKNLLEFFLVENPAHPGEYFPRASGMRFHYDPSRPQFDVVTAVEMGDLDRGYRAIDISGKDERLYSLTCPLMLAMILVAIPKYTKGKLTLVPKNREGQPLKSTATRPTCCRQRARRIKPVSPP